LISLVLFSAEPTLGWVGGCAIDARSAHWGGRQDLQPA
jgi:hypothetical protein